MRVLVVHNRYRSDQPSGENRVVDAEISALKAAGVKVSAYLRSSDEISDMTGMNRIAVSLRPLHSRSAVSAVESLIRRDSPDVLHIHNPYPLISLSVVGAAHRHDIPVVATVHNHRHSCMRGSYFRDGHPCTLCRGKAVPWPAVANGCYRDSHLQSVPMMVAFAAHRRDQRAVDRYIALTESGARSILESGLVTPEQVVVRPNSVPDPGPPGDPGSGLLYVGRLTQDKGVPLLLDAWARAGRPFGTLTFIGTGPEEPRVRAAAGQPDSGVVLTGPLEAAAVGRAMRSAAAVVVPSIAPEALPLVVLEAFSHGRAVIATDAAGLGEALSPDRGLLGVASEEGLAEALRAAAVSDLSTLGRSARRTYEARYSPDVVVAAQLAIYRDVIAERLGSR